MFENARHSTSGIRANLAPALQNFLWFLIEGMAVEKQANLQVFELLPVDGVLQVVHSQRDPAFNQTLMLPGFAPVEATVYVVDDGTRSTMLLATSD